MISEAYDTLKEAGASEDKSRRAAEVPADYDRQFADIRGGLDVMRALQAVTFASVPAVLAGEAALWIRVGDVAGQLGHIRGQLSQIARSVHP